MLTLKLFKIPRKKVRKRRRKEKVKRKGDLLVVQRINYF
jgi:hypothetical protein